jgi:hypothetical protein
VVLLPPPLVALFTIAVVSSLRVLAAVSLTASLAVVVLPYLHGDPINVLGYVGLHLASIGLAGQSRSMPARLRTDGLGISECPGRGSRW